MPVTEQNVPVRFEVVLAQRLPPPCSVTETNNKAEEFPDTNSCRMEALLKKFEGMWMVFAWVMQGRGTCLLPSMEKIPPFKTVLTLACQCTY